MIKNNDISDIINLKALDITIKINNNMLCNFCNQYLGASKCVNKMCGNCCIDDNCKRHQNKKKNDKQITQSELESSSDTDDFIEFYTNEQIEEITNILLAKDLPMEIVIMIIDIVDDRKNCYKCEKKVDDESYILCKGCDTPMCDDCQNDIFVMCPYPDCYYCKKNGVCFNNKTLFYCDTCYENYNENNKKFCYKCDGEVDIEIYARCSACYVPMCDNCQNIFHTLCPYKDCYYCKQGSCFNNEEIIYCDTCYERHKECNQITNEDEYNDNDEISNNDDENNGRCICDDEANYKLILLEDVYCPYCKYTKYRKNKIILYLCDLKCEELYWMVYKNDDDTVSVLMEKDECNKCGKRDFPDPLFSCERIGDFKNNTKICSMCDKNKVKYNKVKFINDVVCPACNTLNYKNNQYIGNICSTKCRHSIWDVISNNYLTSKKSKNTEFLCTINCIECKKPMNDIHIKANRYI